MINFRLYDSVPQKVIEDWKAALSLLGSQTSSLREKLNSRENLSRCENMSRCEKLSKRENSSDGENLSGILSKCEKLAGDLSACEKEERRLLSLINKYEDAGYGSCVLKDDNVAQIVHDAIFFYNNKKYNVISWCIMPNHVHVLIELIENVSLSNILHSWRSFSSNEINKILNRTGRLWMPEYFDRFIRDNEHFNNVVNYIHNNPVKAGLVDDPTKYKWNSAGYANFSSLGPQASCLCFTATPNRNQPPNTKTKI